MLLDPRPEAGRRLRSRIPIHAYVGANGGGKTACMVWDTIPTLEAGRPVLSTVRLLDYKDPRPCDDPECTADDHDIHRAAHPLWVPFTEWRQLVEWKYGDVLMDEVSGVASSRASMSMPAIVENLLQQLRRDDVFLRWTAPSWARADTIIRSCSQAVTSCRGYLPTAAFDADGNERAWRHRRLFMWRTYSADDFTEFTDPKQQLAGVKKPRLKPLRVDRHWGPGSPSFSAYDTYDSVLSIGTVSDSGRCLACGGARRAPQCSCSGYVRPTRARRVADPRVPLAGAGLPPVEGECDHHA